MRKSCEAVDNPRLKRDELAAIRNVLAENLVDLPHNKEIKQNLDIIEKSHERSWRNFYSGFVGQKKLDQERRDLKAIIVPVLKEMVGDDMQMNSASQFQPSAPMILTAKLVSSNGINNMDE